MQIINILLLSYVLYETFYYFTPVPVRGSLDSHHYSVLFIYTHFLSLA